MKAIETIFSKMRETSSALDNNEFFRFSAEIHCGGGMSVYLWTRDYKETVLTYHFSDIEREEEAQEALGALAYVLGYAKGYQACEAEASAIDFATGENPQPATVETEA